jgi:hypothetical protein
MNELRNAKYGKDIELTEPQRLSVLDNKQRIIAIESNPRKKVRFGEHSLTRIFQRVGSDSEPIIIGLIKRLILTDKVYKAQWKGYPHLTYTVMQINDPEEYKFSISFMFERCGENIINVITVSNLRDNEHQWNKECLKMLIFRKC